MADTHSPCVLCRGVAGDVKLQRIQVWEDALWRLTLSLEAEVLGFAYLEPKRHIPRIADLVGEEARGGTPARNFRRCLKKSNAL